MNALILAAFFIWSLAQSDHIQANDLSLDMNIWVGGRKEEPLMDRSAYDALTVSRSQSLKVAVEIFIKDVEHRIVPIEYRLSLSSGCGDAKPWVIAEEHIEMPTYQGYGFVMFIDCDELYLGEAELKGTVYARGRSKVLGETGILVEVLP